jgi:ABC-type multidrug transport system fused ATPase/permease subunit
MNINNVITFLTTFEIFFYVWLSIFLFLLIILIFLIIKYYKIKKKIKNKIIKEKEEYNKFIYYKIKEFDEVIKIFEENFKQGNLNKAIIDSYSKLRNIITNHFNIFVNDYFTEKEVVVEIYSKHPSLVAYSSMIYNIYLIYEKARFSEEGITSEECSSYHSYLKELVNFLKRKYGSV